MSNKLSATQYFVFASLIIGVIGCIYRQKIFTADTLAETCLIVCSLGYLISKFYASKTILKYQNIDYKPNKKQSLMDAFIVEGSFHVIIPLSISFLYAGAFLLLLKYFPIKLYKTTANLINPILDFKKEYIKFPVAILTFVLGILVLTRYISIKKYRWFKTFAKYVMLPFQILLVLTFFLVQDKGIQNNLLKYHFNSKPVISEFVTFNANQSNEDNKKIEEALKDYISYVIERLDAQYKSDTQDDTSQNLIIPKEYKLNVFVQQYPEIKNEVNEIIKSEPLYRIENNDEIFTKYESKIWQHPHGKPQSSNLYTDATKKSKSFFDEFISIIAHEQKTIKVKPLSENAEIVRELAGDILSEIFPFEKFTNVIPISSIIEDEVVDALNDKIINSFYSFFSKTKVTKSDVVDLNNYIDDVLISDYEASLKSVKNKFKILSRYYSEMNKAATTTFVANKKKTSDPSILDYEKGLTEKKYYMEILREKELKDNVEKEKAFQGWRKRYPSATEEKLESAWSEVVHKYYNDRIAEIDDALSEPDRLKNYEYIRDQFSAGGIFFGSGISAFDNYTNISNNICSQIFYPSIINCPNVILSNNIQSVELNDGYLFIIAGNKKYRSETKISNDLLLDAYSYVYSNHTYPVLIDGFYNDNDNEIFAYNRNIIFDKEFTKSLYNSDNFIFDLLQGKNTNADVQKRFHEAILNYTSSKGEVSLSRIYDDKYFISLTPANNFEINSRLIFSVVSKNASENTDLKYREMTSISSSFNTNYTWLLNKYSFLNDLNRFASYQALFRSVPQKNVDISDLVVRK